MREWVVREVLEKPDDADRLALERLGTARGGIDHSIERAELLMQKGRVDEATAALVDGVPASAQLTREQSARLATVILKIDPKTLATGDAARIGSALHLLDLIAGRVPLGDQLHRMRLVLLTAAHYDDPKRLIEAAEALGKEIPARPLDGYVVVLTELEKRPEVGPAARFAAAAANHVKPPMAALYMEWMNIVAFRGGVADVDHFAENLTDPEGIDALLAVMEQRAGGNLVVPNGADEKKAEVLYQLGSLTPSEGREAAAEHAYRLCLKIRPNHPWASNNLGYQLLERNEKLEEAERLIRAAYAELSGEASVVDSMGWLMYKLGQYEDVVDDGGEVKAMGAVSLLGMAAADSPQNPTLSDHYADALWRAGKQDQAKLQWQQAEAMAEAIMDQMKGDDPLARTLRPTMERTMAGARAKAAAARDGKPPAVAAIFSELKSGR
jgi:tetratricopeptide (TPR) repeat protein